MGSRGCAAHLPRKRSPRLFEVMMFGMTGAGKSALGNLIAGQNIFDSGSLTKVLDEGSGGCFPQVTDWIHSDSMVFVPNPALR